MDSTTDLLERDTPFVGASCMLHSKPVLELFAEAGLDYVFLDFEHNGGSVWDAHLLEDYVRVTEHTGLEPVVRIVAGNPETLAGLVRKVLDTGIRNIVVPRVRSPEEVRMLAKAARFHHEGKPGQRGVSAGRGSRWGANVNEEWLRAEDETANLGIMVENAEAVQNLDQMVTIEGMNFVLIGSMDLSVDLGDPTNKDTAKFNNAIDEIVEVCNTHDIPFGQLGADIDQGKRMVDRGASFFHAGSDVGFIRDGLDGALDHF